MTEIGILHWHQVIQMRGNTEIVAMDHLEVGKIQVNWVGRLSNNYSSSMAQDPHGNSNYGLCFYHLENGNWVKRHFKKYNIEGSYTRSPLLLNTFLKWVR